MPYICPRCGQEFPKKYNRDKHLNKKFKCPDLLGNSEKPTKSKNLEEIIIKQQEQITELMNIIQSKQNTVNNTTNNKTITNNLNFVVNNFSNAKNIEECLNIDNVDDELLEQCENVYMKDGAAILIQNLCNIGVQERPFHCTDPSRDKYIVRSNDQWTLDPNANTIRSHLEPVAQETYKIIYKDKLSKNKMDLDAITKITNDMAMDLGEKETQKNCRSALRETMGDFMLKNHKDINTEELILMNKPEKRGRGRPKKIKQ